MKRRQVTYKRVPYGRTSYGRALHGRASHGVTEIRYHICCIDVPICFKTILTLYAFHIDR
jgi:hypothetical protein